MGDDYVVGVRLSWDEFLGPEGGITAEQSEEQIEVCKETAQAGQAKGFLEKDNQGLGGRDRYSSEIDKRKDRRRRYKT